MATEQVVIGSSQQACEALSDVLSSLDRMRFLVGAKSITDRLEQSEHALRELERGVAELGPAAGEMTSAVWSLRCIHSALCCAEAFVHRAAVSAELTRAQLNGARS